MNTKQILITALVIALTLTVVAIAVSTPTASMARADSCTSEGCNGDYTCEHSWDTKGCPHDTEYVVNPNLGWKYY
ncbi:MAG: hypothetical protein WAK17_01595 [Candidatus Nitrosopolaris sp.]|jgi:hypothetical protein